MFLLYIKILNTIINIFTIFCDGLTIEFSISFNEMGIHDLPAMITFITNKRSQLLDMYIGHSMGTTAFYIMASERPKIAQIVRKMISFAPIAFINHMKTPVMKYLSNKSFIKLFKVK